MKNISRILATLVLALMVCVPVHAQQKVVSGQARTTTTTSGQKKSGKKSTGKTSNKQPSVPFSVDFALFGNREEDRTIIDSPGSPLYSSEMRYLFAEMHITPKVSSTRNVDLRYKIYYPDGTLSTFDGSPEGYTGYFDVDISSSTTSFNTIGYGNSSMSIYEPGTYRYGLYYNGKEIWSGAFVVLEDVDLSPLTVNYGLFGNREKDGTVINTFGSTLYASKMRYLYAEVYITPNLSSSRKLTFYYRLYRPDGTLSTYDGSPSGYTGSFDATIGPNTNSFKTSGYGNATTSTYESGTYTYELYLDDKKIWSDRVTIMGDNNSCPITVTSVSFGNLDYNGTVLTSPGSTLYASSMQYLNAKVYFNTRITSKKEIDLYIKIINPDGTIISGTSSPAGYSTHYTFTINPGDTNLVTRGFGSSSGTTYPAGTYRYELYYDDQRIWQSSFTVR